MLSYSIISLSILFQLLSAILAVRLIKVSGKQLSWTLIAIAMVLQALRRVITLINIQNGNLFDSRDFISELIGLAVSVVMFAGVAGFSSFLRKSRRSYGERKEAEDALEVEQALFQKTFDLSLPSILIKLPENMVVRVNPGFEKLFGYTCEEVTGKPVEEFDLWADATDRQFVTEEFYKSGKITDHQFVFKTKSGETGIGIYDSETIEHLTKKFVLSKVMDVTHLVQTQLSLQESESKFRKLYDEGSFGMALINREFRFISANPTYIAMVGYSESELQNKTFNEITHPDDANTDIPFIEKLIAQEIPVYKTEKRYIRKDGQVMWGSLTVTSNFNTKGEFLYNLAILEDISDRKAVYERVIKSEERYHDLIDQASDGIFISDGSGQYIEVNTAGCQLLGYTRDEILQKSFYDLIANSNEQPIRMDELRKGKSFLSERELIRKDGTHIPVEISAKQLSNGNFQGIVRDITERKKAENELRQSEEKFRNFFEKSVVGKSMTTMDGKMQINKAYQDILGYSEVELNSLKWSKITHPDEIEKDRMIVDSIISGEHTSRRWEKRNIHKDGHYVWVDISTYLQRDSEQNPLYFITSVLDITDRKKAEETLRESRAKLDAALASMTDAVFISNKAGEFIEFNEAFATFHKFANKNECAKTLVEYPDFLEVYMDNGEIAPIEMWAVSRALRGETATNEEYSLRRKDTGESWVGSYSFSPIRDEENRIVGSVVVGRDITKRKLEEQEIRRLNSELEQRVNERTTQLANSNKELEAFSYSVSHDLRAPLRGIDGFSLALFEDYSTKLDETAKNYIERIRYATKKMDGLIDSLLKLARISRIEMNSVKINLSQLVEEIAYGLRESDNSRKVKFIIPEKITVLGDPNLLKIVLENLLYNAWKFTSKEEESIIEIGTIVKDSKLTYFIKDNGIGFDMQYAGKLFTAFQRLHSEKDYPGTGVGLTTVQRIIHRHNGEIYVESELNKGTTFYFTL